uniref:Putative ovule protein n=1 Tax=Solanum chacoense TaxID=4108 RepID=A0A0V0H748_SOLCH
MRTYIPVILDEAITNLNPDFFWFGVDEIDLKLGIRPSEFINFVKPFIVNCSEKSPQLVSRLCDVIVIRQ